MKQKININLNALGILMEVRLARFILYACGFCTRREDDYICAWIRKGPESYAGKSEYPDVPYARLFVDEITGYGMMTSRLRPEDEIDKEGNLNLHPTNVLFLEETVDPNMVLDAIIRHHNVEWVKHDTAIYFGHKKSWRQKYTWCLDSLDGITIESSGYEVTFKKVDKPET